MTHRESDIQITGTSFENCTIPINPSFSYYQPRFRFTSPNEGSVGTLDRILKRLARMNLPGKDHVEAYLRHLTRRNRRPRTLESRFGAIILFLGHDTEKRQKVP